MERSICELAWNVSEPEYRADPALSYSTLSRFEREGWRKLDSLFDRIETPSLTFGSAVDCMLTEGDEAFTQRFIVCEFPSLSDNLISITKALYHRFSNEHRKVSTIEDKYIDEVALSNGYYTNPKYANYRVKNIKESCDEYYSLLSLAGEKTILSQSDYNDVVRCVEELRTSPATKHFFSNNPWDTNLEKVFQLKFKTEWNGIPIRCMFDCLSVDHKDKVIYPVDLKTTGHPEEEFYKSFITWRYDIQATFYTYILQSVLNKDPYFSQFRIKPFQFVPINRRTLAPLVWEFKLNFNERDLKDEQGNIYRNWRKILADLNYYITHPNLKYSREAIAYKYQMEINNVTPV
jgi:hypothetical protein